MANGFAFFDSQCRYVLDISNSTVTADVLRFNGREALSSPFCWHIEFTTDQADIPVEQVLLKYASLRMRSGKTVPGIITGLQWLATSADQSHYCVTLESRLALLSRSQGCAVYQNQSVPEVVELVLRAHGLEGPDFEFRLERTYPPREVITQWRETDLQFIQRLLSEVGIWFRSEIQAATEQETLIFADSALYYQFDVRLPYCEPCGLDDGAEPSVWGVRTWHQAVTGRVSTRDYHYPSAGTPLDASVSVRHDAVTIGEHEHNAPPYQRAGDDTDPEPETESGAFYARLHHERELNQSARAHLFSNTCSLRPGMVLEPQGKVIQALKPGLLITLTSFIAARDSRLHVSVWGQPYTERYGFRPPAIPRPQIHGTLPARVESREKNDRYAWLDTTGRYRVKLDVDRNDTEPGYAYLWLRMAKPYTGAHGGWHTPLIDGTEVAIAFSKGDIDLPYIAYALHDTEHPDPVNRDNHTRNLLRTPANSTLCMEDQRQQEHITLATEFGKTQLNTGHLVDAAGKLRGTGAELRTDEHGALRAAKGLFISADAQHQATGKVLDSDAALENIARLQQQLRQLEAAAVQAEALQADIDRQLTLYAQRLTSLNEMIHFSAPQGMAFTSGEHLQLAASKNVAINAGGDISVGVMGKMTALSGETLGLFARTGPLSLKSGEGPIEMQAQNGNMRLFAEQKLTISSEDDLLLVGKKRITLIGGGSYLTLDAGKIEYGTLGQYLRKVARTTTTAAASQHPDMPWLADPVHKATDAIMQYLYHDNTPVVGAAFTATLADGSVRTGNLDGEGYLYLEHVPAGNIQVQLGADARRYQRKDMSDNQKFTGASADETAIDALIAQHSGGVA
ncbi:type VI secretion system tip protein VgrG [Acerihabitans sp. TG2]|uniref:type VI secretion system Vgr family protein n=1 Tax=Acerihabitans sp. TG2 TaxID=3096008 RepID=UPI002B22E4E5|nr:type VI secretion system tip protein VgrG [Acerihabitans sp. TG2]MEA9390187.1 type VI secretion system tip protein VgrG [Acerihabitans sp. TG2]